MKYRAEIDGLRALAVVPVILFHAGFELFSGGFVGVDVFFVISGYLITTILIEDIENKRFSIVNFYERRARRILPALFFVMLVCIPFAWMWMLPNQMKDFSQSLVAVSLFASNILFWRESGYFDAAAEEKPLLHTWSLAVEEQYYVLFPIFLIFAWRFGKNRVFWMIVVMSVISLMLSEWGWRNKATANFYLAPTRAWELFSGSIAAFVVQKYGVQKNNLLSLIGLAAIIFSIFCYDETTPFPSVYALVPVLGVVMLVLYADKETLAAKLLSTKGFVGVGLISYSAYLWHQPLFAFARIRSLEHPSVSLMLSLTLASLALAYFSWRYIEKPFRKNSVFTTNGIFSFSAISLLAFMMFGYAGHREIISVNLDDSQVSLYGAFQEISNARTAAYFEDECHYTGRTDISNEEFLSNWQCYFEYENQGGMPHVAVAGDSNAADIANGFRLNKLSVTSMSGSGCNLVPSLMSIDCKSMFEKFIDFANSEEKIKVLIITNLFTQNEYSQLSISEMIDFWKRFRGDIVYLHDTPRFPNHYEALLRGVSPVIDLHYENLHMPDDIKDYLHANNIHTESRNELFCQINSCNYFSIDGDALISDKRGEHLSLEGAKSFVKLLVRNLSFSTTNP
ncbi:acyltransferase [Amylibacter sp.]|nr:acyltransferase [Amylibacter sp.]